MNETSANTIIEQLMDNTTDIITAASNDQTERFKALTCRQNALLEVLKQSGGFSPLLLRGLHIFLKNAIDVVNTQLDLKHDRIIATGIKKKVFRAYGAGAEGGMVRR